MVEERIDALPCIREESQARVLRAFGDELLLHLGTDDTGGKFSMWTNVTPPGGGPPPHYHEHEDEWFLPLSGPAEFFYDGTWSKVEAKTAVFMPRGVVHAFRNPGESDLRMLIQTIPGGFEKFFAECAEEFDNNTGPDMARIVEISAQYGIHYVE